MPNPIEGLCLEYASVLRNARDHASSREVVKKLVDESEWTPRGAETVVTLARRHGAFVLRNALALAEVLGHEDGTDGL